jgi:sulfate/thiosulfate transport system permease protein
MVGTNRTSGAGIVASRFASRTTRGPRRWRLRTVVLVYLGLLVGLPVGYLFVKAFGSGFGAFWREVSQPGSVGALELSLKVALVVVPANTIAGIMAALLIARKRIKGRRFLDLAFDIPVAVSPIVVGAALILAYAERTGWFGPWLLQHGISVIFTPTGIVIASMAVSLPYVLRSVVPVLVEVGETQEQAARTLGASAVRRFVTITLPAIRWALLYGVMLTFARTLGEIGAVLVVSGNITGRTQTAPIYIYDSWDQNYDAFGALAGAAVLALISIVVLILLSILRTRERRLRVDLA